MTDIDHLVFVAHSGQVSGAEKVMLDLVDEALRRGLAVTVACPSGPLTDRLPTDVTHLEIDQLGLTGETGAARLVGAGRLIARWWRSGRRLAPQMRRPGTATIVNSMYALPAARIARPPRRVGWLVHDTIASGRQQAVTRISRAVIGRAVAVSEATARPLRDLDLPVAVAHNGVAWPVPALSTEVHAPPVVGILALLTPWKGHHVLLDAVALLPGVELELAGGSFPGDADHIDQLHSRATEPDLDGRVRFLGHTALTTALERWDVVVSASVSPEAGPLSVLEAMSYGKPVVGTDHGGTTEFLADGAGLLVPPGDADALAGAIATLLADRSLRAAVTLAARARIARRHDISVTLPAMLDALLPQS